MGESRRKVSKKMINLFGINRNLKEQLKFKVALFKGVTCHKFEVLKIRLTNQF